MAFTFGNININSKKQVLNLKTIADDKILLWDNSQAYACYKKPVIVLLDQHYNTYQIKAIRNFLEANRITRYKLVLTLNCVVNKEQIKEDQKTGIVAFYRNNSSNFWKEVEEDSIIITVGAALYAVTQSDDIYPDHMHERIFGKSHFWFSRETKNMKNIERQQLRGNWIFPIDSFTDIFAYGFSSPPVEGYKTELTRFQFKAVIKYKDISPPRYPKLNKIFIYTKEEFIDFYNDNKYRKNDLMAWDLETSGFDFLTDKIGCITISFDGLTGYYIRWSAVETELLDDLFKNNIQIGANLKFDWKFVKTHGLKNARIDEDVIVLGHILDETRSNSLKALAYLYSEFGGYDWELDEYKRKTKIDNYLDIPEDILKEYAVMDAIVTLRVFRNIKKHLKELDIKFPNEIADYSLEHYYKNIRMPAVNMYAEIEYNGVPVNIEKLAVARDKTKKLIADLETQMAEELGVSKFFDFNSATRLGKLFEKKGWECHGRAKAGHYLTGDPQLARWAENHKEAKTIQKYRSAKTIFNTYIGEEHGDTGWSALLHHHPEDNSYRVHPNYFPLGTESGRTRCKAPNMMNIPTRGEIAKDVKKFVATPNDEDYYIVTVDFSALQMRLAAADGDETNLIELFKEDRLADVHTRTSYGVFVKGNYYDLEEITVEQDGKVYNFLGDQQIKTLERGDIFAKDLTENDTLVFEN